MQETFQKSVAKYDTKNVLESVQLFPKQCRSAWEAEGARPALGEPGQIHSILVCGMGGSALGVYILQALDAFTVPINISHDYNIPNFVNEHTLVIAISYSGGTEETLSATKNAVAKNAHVVCITVGGKLEKIANENSLDLRKIDTEFNPCGQPRFGVGFMIMHTLKVAMDYDVCKLSKDEIEGALSELANTKTDNAFTLAQTLADKMPVLVYAEHLVGVGRFARNQLHETAKTLALAHEIPELNHHLMEGLEFPDTNKEKVHFVFFESDLYSEKINKRIAVTKDVLAKQEIGHTSVQAVGASKLGQILLCMQSAMNLAYTIGILHEKDPSDIKWVNYFKEQLGK